MKIFLRMLIAIMLLGAGVAIGYPIGRHDGFLNGSEWAILQADLAAREEGVFMPVYYSDGSFHVVLKQQRGIYREARRLAENEAATELLQRPSEPVPEPVKVALLEGEATIR